MHARFKQHPAALWCPRIDKLYRTNEPPPALGEELGKFFLPRKNVREQRSSLRGKHATAVSELASTAGFRWAAEPLSELVERLPDPFRCSLRPSKK
jgi:hypothetical protein